MKPPRKEDPPNLITPKGFAVLKAEFEKLAKAERPKLLEVIAWAASNGDRSENADYIYGKRRLREIDKKLEFLTRRITAAKIIDPTQIKSDRVGFGATIEICDNEGTIKILQLVGEDEINAHLGKISMNSPLAQALFGKKVGDEVTIRRPKDVWEVEIINITFKEID